MPGPTEEEWENFVSKFEPSNHPYGGRLEAIKEIQQSLGELNAGCQQALQALYKPYRDNVCNPERLYALIRGVDYPFDNSDAYAIEVQKDCWKAVARDVAGRIHEYKTMVKGQLDLFLQLSDRITDELLEEEKRWASEVELKINSWVLNPDKVDLYEKIQSGEFVYPKDPKKMVCLYHIFADKCSQTYRNSETLYPR